MAGNKLNSFRITVILVVFVILCYVDWSPSAKQRSRRSPLSTRSTTIYNSCQNNGEIGVTFVIYHYNYLQYIKKYILIFYTFKLNK